MARYQNYSKKGFSASQNFLARDPAGSGQVIRVQGQSILDAAVADILNRSDIVQAVDTLDEAKANDYSSGTYVLTGGSSVVLDGGQSIYRVSDPGSGGIVMDNGNELVLLYSPGLETFDSVENIAGSTGTFDNQQKSLLGWHPNSDVGGGILYWDSSLAKSSHNGVDTFSPTVPWTTTTADYLNAVGETDPAGSGCWRLKSGQIIYDLTKQVPSDFATLQEAIEHIDKFELVGEIEGVVNVETGHALTLGLNLRHKNYSQIRITSDDATVSLSAGFVGADTSGIDAGILGETPAAPFMLVALGATSPVLDTVIDMGNSFGTGIQVAEGEAIVNQGCGVINAGFRGIQVHGRANIYAANFNGASGTGIRLQQSSSCNARDATADNCCSTADLTNSAVYVSRSSTLEFRGGSAQNSGASGLIARRSIVTADDANFDGAADKGIEAETCSQVSFSNGSALNTVSSSLRCISGANLYAVGASTSTTSSAKNLDVDVGGVITVAGGNTIEGLAATEAQVLAESTVQYLGAFDPRGMIFYDDGNGTFKITTNANGISQRFADGRMRTWVTGFLDTGTISSGSFSGALTLPTQPDTFITTDSVLMTVVGRTSAGGGGNRVAVNNYHRGITAGTEWKIENKGVQLDGGSTGLNVASIDYQIVSDGTWK